MRRVEATQSGRDLQARLAITARILVRVSTGLVHFILLWWLAATTGKLTTLALAGLAIAAPRAILDQIAHRRSHHIPQPPWSGPWPGILSDALATLVLSGLIPLFWSGEAAPWQVVLALAIYSAWQGLPLLFAPTSESAAACPDRLPAGGADHPDGRPDAEPAARLRATWQMVSALLLPAQALVPLFVLERAGGGILHAALMMAASIAGIRIGAGMAPTVSPAQSAVWAAGALLAACMALALTGLAPTRLFGAALIWWTIAYVCHGLSTPIIHRLSTSPSRLPRPGWAAVTGLVVIALIGRITPGPGVATLFVTLGLLGALACLPGLVTATRSQIGARDVDAPGPT